MHNRPQTPPVFAVWHEQESVLRLVAGNCEAGGYAARDEFGGYGHSSPRRRHCTLLIEDFLPLAVVPTQHGVGLSG